MPPAPPTQAELLALAERALALLEGEGQVSAWWERSIEAGEEARLDDRVTVEVVRTDGQRRGAALSTLTDPDSLAALGAAAAPVATSVHTAHLPEPVPGRPHDAWDASAATTDLARARARALAGGGVRWRGGAARTAIASTRGVRAVEQRSFAHAVAYAVRAGHDVVSAEAVATGVAGIDFAGLAAAAAELAGGGELVASPAGATPVVLGPRAVAAVLESLKPALVADEAPPLALGTRVVAACVNLSDSPRFPGGLARSYDVEGAPRRPVPLLQDGIAHRVVADTASAALTGVPSTGHARLAGAAFPWPDHLVLTGGGAQDVAELMRPLAEGLYVSSLVDLEADAHGWSALTDGAWLIEYGRRTHPVAAIEVEWEPLALLATAQALSMRQQVVLPPRHPFFDDTEPLGARTVGATVAPALRCAGGLRVVGAAP